ncbi:MAG: DUF362 domain-containing protein [Candidatus Aminicenantes bacterium]|nr:DUF362 domain-containing protein [Candidatus Aminicenantes bacterium]
MKRRDFLTGLAIGTLFLNQSPWLKSQGSSLADIAWVEGDDPAAITKKAIELLGGMKRFISRGERVIIKPNIGWDRTPELAACTNPEVVRALVEMCFEAGAKEVIVTDNSTNAPQRCFPRSGIEAAAKAAGAKVLLPNPYRLKKTAIKGVWLKEWEVFTDFLEADKIINVPIAKHHSLSRLTLGMKNWLGALGGPRNQLHQRLDEAMVDLAAFFRPVLTVMDAYRILLRNGPQGGRLSDVKLQKMVVAGIDPVAVDSLTTTFFDLKPEDLAYLPMAKERGLGEINFERLRLEKRKI